MKPPVFNPLFNALLKEAQFTKEMLGSGATQIRKANYALKGIYFQAFTSLSTGLERIGKLCLMLDFYLDRGKFPDLNYLKVEIGHKITLIYEKSAKVAKKRSLPFKFLQNLDGSIHQAILKILSDFAQGDRYSNIDLAVGSARKSDPIASWYTLVDQPIFNIHIPEEKKELISRNAEVVGAILGAHSRVLFLSETGEEISDIQDGSFRTGVNNAIVPYRQLYVLQIIRYWTEMLCLLQFAATGDDIPDFGEIFALFHNDDSYLRTKKVWAKL